MKILRLFKEARAAESRGSLDSFLDGSGLSEAEKSELLSMIRVVGSPNDGGSNTLSTSPPAERGLPGIYQHYLDSLREKGWHPDVVSDIDDSVRESAKRLELRDPVTRPGYGMIIGRIQSGKTAHMIGLVLHSVDSEETPRPFDTVIVLSGLINDLRLQTRARFEGAVSGFSGKSPDIIPGVKADLSEGDSSALDDLRKKLADPHNSPIVVIKKNHVVLGHLLSCLPEEGPSSRRVLIIDDEADHASVDIGGDEEVEEESGEGLVDNPSLTNKRLRRIVKRLEGWKTCWYLGYTATPFANLLSSPGMGNEGDENGPSLHPRDMLQVLDKPEGHLDNEQYFLTHGRPNVEDRLTVNPQHSDEEREDFRGVVLRHILTQLVKDQRGIKGHHSTLIHTSIQVNDHRRIAALIRQIIDDMKEPEGFESAIKDIRRMAKNDYQLPDLETNDLLESMHGFQGNGFDGWLDLLGTRIEVIEVNSRPREPGEDEGRDLVYGTAPRSFIAIGGTRLSRGLTLEGLTTSWFTRRASEPKYDTMLQQARWCGYRSILAVGENGEKVEVDNYRDLVRILTTEQIRDDFVNITNEEVDLREKIRALGPDADPMEHRIWIREHPGMRITKPQVMEGAISIPWGNLLNSTTWSWESPALGEDAGPSSSKLFKSVKSLLGDAAGFDGPFEDPPKGETNFKLIFGTSDSFVKKFLDTYHSLLETGTETEQKIRGLSKNWDSGRTWNIALHSPDRERSTTIAGAKVGLVNRSASNGKIAAIQNSGLDTRIDIPEGQHIRESPLLLVYLVDQASTFREEGRVWTFSDQVKNPVPIFGICQPMNLDERGGWEWGRPDV